MKGPKTILSETIANALGEYFCISPKDVETKLMGEAGIFLRDMKLKPLMGLPVGQVFGNAEGQVSSVSFQWQWGHEEQDGGSDWIKNAHLTIVGLRFSVKLSHEATSSVETIATVAKKQEVPKKEAKTTKKNDESTMMAYIQNQVNVTDFEFELYLPDSTLEEEALVYGGSGFEIASLGRTKEGLLKLDLTIANIFALLRKQTEMNSSIPVLDEISYKASAIRKETNKLSTIQVKGESNQGGIVMHIGSEQIQFLNTLAGLMMKNASETEKQDPDVKKADEKTQHATENDSADDNNTTFTTALQDDIDAVELSTSVVELPLDEVALVLPNGTKLSLSGIALKYHFDGSVFTVRGHDGIMLNETHPLLGLSGACFWQVDLVTSQFQILNDDSAVISYSNDKEDEVMALCHARQQDVDSIMDGVQQAQEIYNDICAKQSGAIGNLRSNLHDKDDDAASLSVKKDEVSPASLSPWSASIRGGFGLSWEPIGGDAIEMEMRNFQANMADMSVIIGSISKMNYAQKYYLSEPLEHTMISFDGRLLSLDIGNLIMIETTKTSTKIDEEVSKLSIKESSSSLKESKDSGISSTTAPLAEEKNEAPSPATIPFGIVANIGGVTLEKESISKNSLDKQGVKTTDDFTKTELVVAVTDITIAVGPHSSDDDEKSQMLRVCVAMNSVKHSMVRLNEPLCSFIMALNDLIIFEQFFFKAKNVSVTAGYTVFEWKKLLGVSDDIGEEEAKNDVKGSSKKKKKKKEEGNQIIVRLPQAHIDPLKIKAVVNSDLAGFKEHVFNIDQFQGTQQTTSKDVIQFYAKNIIAASPGLISNAEILGFNVKDAAAVSVGTASKFLGGVNPLAGVASVVAVDGVSNAIKAGKKNRGMEEDDKTHFTDFFRGLAQAASDAAAKGAERRGKSSVHDSLDPLDWAVGATEDVGSYANENKARLGGAGAGVGGFMVGFALGGPVGGIIGGLAASKVTEKTIDAVSNTIEKNQKKKKQLLETLQEKEEDDHEGVEVEYDVEKSAEENTIELISKMSIVRQGFLWKRGSFVRSDWQKHYFMLEEGGKLHYFSFVEPQLSSTTSSPDEEGHEIVEEPPQLKRVLQTLVLNQDTISVGRADDYESETNDAQQPIFVFTLNASHHNNPVWILAAETDDLREAWDE
eukprot:CAMPEP_0178938874 /NCGR_PEP_ID=MMETSP0786-20121207/26572_1 /TAXON_ID=186022 /ORGANISM="Thalassionema frauenfeldii, Strain CCMP 1798" /LENGTH=1153 /DNA_ID=CAMNT_0020617639 /DNA_START=89 /DNA_END=3547 /DNA_ORIENTATION=-